MFEAQPIFYEWAGLALVAVVWLLLIVAVWSWSELSPRARKIATAGLLVIAVGSQLRHYVLFAFYDGVGDVTVYYRYGAEYVARWMNGDYTMLTDPNEWRGGNWWGTNFVYYYAGLTHLLIGPSLRGAYLVFGLITFFALWTFAAALRRSGGVKVWESYLPFLLLWPSLWWWPNILGKDAVVLLGTALVARGFVGNGEKPSMLWMAAGITLAFAIRPQAAAVVFAAVVIATLVAPRQEWTLNHVVTTVVLMALSTWTLYTAFALVGIESVDVEGVGGYVTTESSLLSTGGSAIDPVPFTPLGAVQAAGNTLFRPFVWEASNPFVFAAGAEMLVLWLLVWRRRRYASVTLRGWREDRFIRFGLVFTLIYAVLLGFSVSNLSILARQRIFILPFLLALLPARSPARATAVHLRRRVGPRVHSAWRASKVH